MRHSLVLLGLLFSIGCTTPLPLDSGQPSTGGNGPIADGGAQSHGDVDLAPPLGAHGDVDLAPPLGAPGDTCKTACDCQAGLACFQQKCIKTPIGQLYCCESDDCPAGSFCESKMGGFRQCGGGGRGGGGGNGG
jgi:hypothetical protein